MKVKKINMFRFSEQRDVRKNRAFELFDFFLADAWLKEPKNDKYGYIDNPKAIFA